MQKSVLDGSEFIVEDSQFYRSDLNESASVKSHRITWSMLDGLGYGVHGLRPYLEESVELGAVVVVHVVAQLMKGSLEN